MKAVVHKPVIVELLLAACLQGWLQQKQLNISKSGSCQITRYEPLILEFILLIRCLNNGYYLLSLASLSLSDINSISLLPVVFAISSSPDEIASEKSENDAIILPSTLSRPPCDDLLE